MLLPFFQVMANLELSRSWIPDAQSVKHPLIKSFYLTKTENGTKKALTQLLHYCQKMQIFDKKC